ncbi:NACHT domain-containing protein (plasmid) [Acaryochloris sp. 'Moss Beach']|uniref:NB-ARC domain-containing protein n=1 Tax=Acaryochloris sp. 'Moss Beach' TaxID=2740837 RepID=UPI001F2D0146|nr:NB-ARC domain-containing protein [Acaryochloris sp. 'Moss Beach']UJB72678.1 NACHT domain-containing protein [Acaryochloris sp. 'Moss Beach']
MNFSQVTKFVNRISLRMKERNLTEAEVIALKAAWEGIGYGVAIQRSGGTYSENYVRSDSGRKLWLMLSAQLGEKITKATLRSYFDSHPNLFSKEKSNSKILGGYPPVTENFIGRQGEIENLKHWATTLQCVCIGGISGIGKTCLAANAIHQIFQQPDQFDYYIWLPVHYKPSLDELLDCLIEHLGGESGTADQQNRSSVFIQFLQRYKCLIVLDEVDLMVSVDLDQEINEYQIFFRRLIEEQHQSCIWLTSNNYSEELSNYKSMGFPCENLHLSPLTAIEVRQVVESHGITFDDDWEKLVSSCMGNPLLLHSVLRKVSNMLGGQADLVNQKTSLALNEFDYLLKRIFANATDIQELELYVLSMIATVDRSQRSIPLLTLTHAIINERSDISELDVINSLGRLQKHNLLSVQAEKGTTSIYIGDVIKKYIVRNFINKAENTVSKSL